MRRAGADPSDQPTTMSPYVTIEALYEHDVMKGAGDSTHECRH